MVDGDQDGLTCPDDVGLVLSSEVIGSEDAHDVDVLAAGWVCRRLYHLPVEELQALTRRECSLPCVGAVDDELCLRVADLLDLHVGA